MIKNIYRSSRKVVVLFVIYRINLIFSTEFPKNTQIPNFVEILPLGADLSHGTDEREESGRVKNCEVDSRLSQFCDHGSKG